MARDDFDDTGYVSITKDEYAYLKERDAEYRRLEAAGVDNWDGYYYAFRGDGEGE